MYEVIYQLKAENKIKSFIDSYKNVFLNTYVDTWLFYEDIIRQNHIDNSKKFYNEIIDTIDKNCIKETIFWYKPIDNKKFQIIVVVWNFRLFVSYTENIELKERYIEDIEFFKK